MKIYVVLDTNVIVASMLTRHHDSATRRIINAITDLKISGIVENWRIRSDRQQTAFPGQAHCGHPCRNGGDS